MFTQDEEDFNYQEEINEIKISMDDAELAVKDGEAVERLFKNRDFKRIFTEGYFNSEARRLVFALAEPACASPEIQAKIQQDIKSIGSLRQFLELITSSGLRMGEEIIKSRTEILNLEAAERAEDSGEY